MWVLNLDFAGSGVADSPTVATVAAAYGPGRPSPASWQTRWRTAGWIRLRPARAA